MKIKLTEDKLRQIIRESITELNEGGYFGDDATPEQFANASQEIADTFNDSENARRANRQVSAMTLKDFINQNGGLQKVGNMNLFDLMDMIEDYIG